MSMPSVFTASPGEQRVHKKVYSARRLFTVQTALEMKARGGQRGEEKEVFACFTIARLPLEPLHDKTFIRASDEGEWLEGKEFFHILVRRRTVLISYLLTL
jgi:hypothetical protein